MSKENPSHPKEFKLKKKATNIQESVRREFGITRDQYAFCAYVVYRCADSRQKSAGWCCDPKEEVANFVGLSRVGLFKMAREMSLFGLIEISDSGAYRGTPKWMDAELECKQSLHAGTSGDVNKVNAGRKQSLRELRQRRKQSLQTPIYSMIKDSKNEGEGNTPNYLPNNFDEMMSEVERLAVEAKKEKEITPVAPPPSFSGHTMNECGYHTPTPLGEAPKSDYYIHPNDELRSKPNEHPLFSSDENTSVPAVSVTLYAPPTKDIIEIIPPNATAAILKATEPPLPKIPLGSRPNSQTPTELKAAMSVFYHDRPLEWSDGVLKMSHGERYATTKQVEIVTDWCCHVIKENRGGCTYGQLNADLQKWFRNQPTAEGWKNSNGQKPENKEFYVRPPKFEKLPLYTT